MGIFDLPGQNREAELEAEKQKVALEKKRVETELAAEKMRKQQKAILKETEKKAEEMQKMADEELT
jgi:hypothetical protein